MKIGRALRIVILFVIIGFALAWWMRRDRDAAVSNHKAPAPVAALDDESAAYAIPGELVVDFRDDESADKIAALGKRLGVTFRAASSYTPVDEVYTVDTGDAEHVLAALRA